MLRFEPATFVSKIDILTTTPIVHNMQNDMKYFIMYNMLCISD